MTTRGPRALLCIPAAMSVLLLSTPAGAAGERPTPGAAGIGDALFPTLGNGGYDVTHYSVAFDWSPNQTFRARTVIEALATQSLSRFNLDFAGNALGRVGVDGVPAAALRHGEELQVVPKHPLPRGARFTVDVAYSGVVGGPVGLGSGFFTTASNGFGTANQPDAGHHVLPSNDHPADKATFDITISAPAGWTAIANGTRVGSRTVSGRTYSHFVEAHPMATELLSIAVDRYAILTRTGPHGLPIRSAVPAGQVARYGPIAALTADQVRWMEDQVGRYPFENYGIHVVRSPLGFALENQTLSVYDPIWFELPRSVWEPTLVHELAHQWFGDSVAPRQWSDVWLNEGHATWYEAMYAQVKGYYTLEQRMRAEYARGNADRAAFGPVAAPKSADPTILFGNNVYDGGALVLFALREKVGEAAFRAIERGWVSLYRDRVASTRDFIDLACRVAQRDLRAFLADWLYGAHTPPMPNHPDWTVNPVIQLSHPLPLPR
jgi:aminopeptidase N